MISKFFNCVELNGYLKILIKCVWENGRRWRGIVVVRSVSTVKKGTSPFNFQSNEPFSKFFTTAPLIRSALV